MCVELCIMGLKVPPNFFIPLPALYLGDPNPTDWFSKTKVVILDKEKSW